jgi:hypothetical protein
MIIISYQFDTLDGVYKDELHLEDDHQLTAEDIEQIKQDRLERWLVTLPENRPRWLK